MKGMNFDADFRLISADLVEIAKIFDSHKEVILDCEFEIDAMCSCDLYLTLKSENVRRTLSYCTKKVSSCPNLFSANNFAGGEDGVDGTISFIDSTILKDELTKVFAEFDKTLVYGRAFNEYNEIVSLINGNRFDVVKNTLKGVSENADGSINVSYKHIFFKVFPSQNGYANANIYIYIKNDDGTEIIDCSFDTQAYAKGDKKD